MFLKPTEVNPLQELLDSIPEHGTELDQDYATTAAKILAKGGVICESFEEVIRCLVLLAEYNSLYTLDKEFYIRKIQYG